MSSRVDVVTSIVEVDLRCRIARVETAVTHRSLGVDVGVLRRPLWGDERRSRAR